MISPTDYKRRVIAHLQSGQASDEVWAEVADCLLAESELCGVMQLDVEIGAARKCECGEMVWVDGIGDTGGCECGKVVTK